MYSELKFLFYFFPLVGLGATLNVAKPKKGSSVAIFGLGAVGLAVSIIFFLTYIYLVLYCSREVLMVCVLFRLLKVQELPGPREL